MLNGCYHHKINAEFTKIWSLWDEEVIHRKTKGDGTRDSLDDLPRSGRLDYKNK